ncbi:MAG TPA: MBL fold metallo-hydrolase [Nordella sp.]|nr:MBL fold metallo-hydrolase [Nordella sp.]
MCRRAGPATAQIAYEGCPVDRHLADGDRFVSDGVAVTAIATPGHGHMAYLVEAPEERMLIAGDAH